MPAVEESEDEPGGGEFGFCDVGGGDGGGEGAESGLDEESELECLVGVGDQRTRVLHGDLPQPDIRVAAASRVN